jgi:hypothetical protein
MKITKLYSFILVLLTVHFSLYATETGTPFSGKEEEDVTQTSVVKKVSFKEQLAEYKTIEESEESSDSDSEPTSEEQIPLVELKQSEFPIHESFNRIISSIGFKNFAKLLEFAFAPKKNIDLNELPKDLMVHHIVAYVKNT